MTLKEKIERESPSQINLYREGIFLISGRFCGGIMLI